jgi:cobalt-zinc-cadmium efflux system membrane fusion protein
MPALVRRLLVNVAARAPAVLTLAAVAGLAGWLALNEWKVPKFSTLRGAPAAPADESSPATVKVTFDPSPDPPGPPTGRIEFPSAEAVRKAGLQTAIAHVKPLAQYVTAYGMVDYEPSLYTQLAARVSGSVWRVEKEVGEPVAKGEALAYVNSAEVGQAKADFLQSLTQFDLRTKTFQRIQQAGAAIKEGTVLEAEAAAREARIRLFNDQQRLLNLGLPVRTEDVIALPDEQRGRFLRLLGLPDGVRREIDPETFTANVLPVTAPFAGVVVRRFAAPGEVVQLSQPKVLFAIADVRSLHADLDVRLEDMAHVRVGQRVTFQPDSRGVPAAQGKVSHVSPEVDEKTRHVKIHVQIRNEDGALRPNTFGTGRVLVREVPRAVVVPSAAVQPVGGGFVAFVQTSESAFQARSVVPGLADGGLTEVSGVREGEVVVTTGSHVLKSELLKDRIAGGD